MTDQTNEGTEEVLVGINFGSEDDTDIELVVMTTGSTTEKDFEIDVNKGFTGQPPYLLTVRRIRPDDHKAMPRPITLKFTKASLGLDGQFTLSVTNKFGNTG